MTYKVDFSGIPWETPMTGVRCKVARDGRRQRFQ